MVLKNFTAHPITLCGIKIESEGIARVKCNSMLVGKFDYGKGCVHVYKNKYGEIEGLPEPEEGVGYIVSRVVHDIAKGKRIDTFYPDKLVRDSEGNIIGCEALGQNC